MLDRPETRALLSGCSKIHTRLQKDAVDTLTCRGGAIGGRGAKAPLKIFKKGKNEKIWGIFIHQVIKIVAFLSSLTRKYILWNASITILALKKGFSFRGLHPPWPPTKGLCPLDPRGSFAPLTTYPRACRDAFWHHIHSQQGIKFRSLNFMLKDNW